MTVPVEPTRLQVGCAFLFLFDLLAICVLLYLALGAGMLVPMDCTIEQERACAAARASTYGPLSIALLVTIAANAGFFIWATRNHSRPIK